MEVRMFGIGTQELLIIFILIFVIFGAKRLPSLGSGLGKAIRNFKQGVSEPDEIDITPHKNDDTKNEHKEG
jgi:sec-independent protein translocase protein TatA